MGIFDLYTKLSTLSTNEKLVFFLKKAVKTEQAFCEVVIKVKKARYLSINFVERNCVKTNKISKQIRRIVAK